MPVSRRAVPAWDDDAGATGTDLPPPFQPVATAAPSRQGSSVTEATAATRTPHGCPAPGRPVTTTPARIRGRIEAGPAVVAVPAASTSRSPDQRSTHRAAAPAANLLEDHLLVLGDDPARREQHRGGRCGAKTRAVPPPRTPVQMRIRLMVPPGRRRPAIRFPPLGAPEPRAVAGHDDHERDHRQHRARTATARPVEVGFISGLARSGRRPPLSAAPQREERSSAPPVLVRRCPDLEAALAVGAVQLQAHGSPCGGGRYAPADAGNADGTPSFSRRPRLGGRCPFRWHRARPPRGASPG